MGDVLIRQSNKLTYSKNDLNLTERRIFYYIIRVIQQQYSNKTIQTELFNENIYLKLPMKEVIEKLQADDGETHIKKSLKSLRKRSFEWKNDEPENDKKHHWIETGYINGSEIKEGIINIEVSKLILPFMLDLANNYTQYSLNVAISLKSKYSQRLYEICSRWKDKGGFKIPLIEFREILALPKSYDNSYFLKEKVLDIAKKELKELYLEERCDLYFEYTEAGKGKNKILSVKIHTKETTDVGTTEDKFKELNKLLHAFFPKQKKFIEEVINQFLLHPNLIGPIYKRLVEVTNKPGFEKEYGYIRYILQCDVIDYKPELSNLKIKETETNEVMSSLASLANKKKQS